MIKSMKFLVADLKAKALCNYKSNGAAAMIKVLFTDGTFAMIMYRFMQASRALHLSPLEMVFNKLISIFGNAVIGRGADFGPGFVMFHSDGIVINNKVRGGSNIHLHHQVTIGDDLNGRAPVL